MDVGCLEISWLLFAKFIGPVAQLGERFPRTEEVGSSILLRSRKEEPSVISYQLSAKRRPFSFLLKAED